MTIIEKRRLNAVLSVDEDDFKASLTEARHNTI